jgi:hypothetical protein
MHTCPGTNCHTYNIPPYVPFTPPTVFTDVNAQVFLQMLLGKMEELSTKVERVLNEIDRSRPSGSDTGQTEIEPRVGPETQDSIEKARTAIY